MPFIEEYKLIIKIFDEVRKYKRLYLKNASAEWPTSAGVYVIWKKSSNNDLDTLLYIGKCGKYKRNKEGILEFNNGSFKQRIGRWIPYRFCESDKDGAFKFNFRYDPSHSNIKKQYDARFEESAYKYSVPYDKIVIDIFIIPNDASNNYTPSLLESKLLTLYLKDYNDLPPANNEI